MKKYIEYLPVTKIGEYFYCRTRNSLYGIRFSDLLSFDGDYQVIKNMTKGKPQIDAAPLFKYNFPRDLYALIDVFLSKCAQKTIETKPKTRVCKYG